MQFRDLEFSFKKNSQSQFDSKDSYLKKLLKIRENSKNEKRKEKVIVIGAGISGLCTAWELDKLGYDVTVLEALTNHIGGRTRTYRLDDNNYGELGAMRIPKSHYLTRHYINKHGLELRKFVQDNPKTFSFIRNRSFKDQGEEKIRKLFDLHPDEAQKSTFEIWKDTVISVAENFTQKELEDLYSHDPKTERIRELDKTTLKAQFKSRGYSEEAIEFIASTWGLETSLNFSFNEFLREEIEDTWTEPFHEIVGGMDLLAQSFYQELKSKVQQGAIVKSIQQSENGVEVHYLDIKNKETIKCHADWLVCTIPLGPLQKVDLGNSISFAKKRAIRRLTYDSASKVLGIAKKRFWELEDDIYGGGSTFDTILGYTGYPSDNPDHKPEISNTKSVFLASYTWGQNARRLDSINNQDLTNVITHGLGRVHKNLLENPEMIEKVISWSWTNFEYSAGAYAYFRPGEQSDLYKELKKPENRIILAGEHCSLTHSWIQGALESAVDAIAYIIEQ